MTFKLKECTEEKISSMTEKEVGEKNRSLAKVVLLIIRRRKRKKNEKCPTFCDGESLYAKNLS